MNTLALQKGQMRSPFPSHLVFLEKRKGRRKGHVTVQILYIHQLVFFLAKINLNKTDADWWIVYWSNFDSESHLALVASLVGRLDAADGEREAALVLEEEGAESPVGRESPGAHREDVDVAVPDPRDLRFRGPSKCTGWQKYSGTQIMLTSKWELRLVYKVSTCLALRRKSHL